MNKKILVVEDDPNLGQILKEYLDLKGYDTVLCRDGEEGLEAFLNSAFQLCLLDVMMPKVDGYSLAQSIRKANKDIPFIFLTAKSLKDDAIKGLSLGADDYITKPFSMEELLLRIKAILRRTDGNNIPKQQKYAIGHFTFEPDKQVLSWPQGERKLTTKESKLLHLLTDYQNQTLNRRQALKQVWGDDSYFNARSMDVYIAKLRKYLREDESLQILTVHGEGFKLVNFR
ncbi:MAG: response regulator transcription factor [Bacteroidota bacterium]